MTYSKQLTTLLVTALLLLALLPALLFAQNDGSANADPGTSDPVNNADDMVSDDDSIPPSKNLNPRSDTRPNPTNIKPAVRNIDQIRPFQPNKATSTSNPISRPNGLEIRPSLEERQAQMEAKRLEIQTNQTERRATLQENSQERISNFAASVSHRMSEVIARIEQVIARIESRVEKIKANGVDTSEAERYLDAAKTDLNTASSFLANIDTDVVDVVTSEDPKVAWIEVRATYQSARDAIRSAHTNMKNAIVSLKSAMGVKIINEDRKTAEIENEQENKGDAE